MNTLNKFLPDKIRLTMTSLFMINLIIILPEKGVSQNNKKLKLYESHYPNGKLEFKGFKSKSGKMEGTWFVYYPSGKVKSKLNYKNDVKNGKAVNYYENGQVKNKGMVVNGIDQGIWLYFHANGQLQTKVNIKNGKIDGERIIYYDDGKIKSREYFKNGKVKGTGVYYYQNGQKQATGSFKNGKQEGVWFFYRTIGKIRGIETYKNGKREGESIIYKLGTPFEKIDYRIFYKDNKQLKSGEYGQLQNGKKEGLWVFIDQKNKLKGIGNYSQGKKEGKWKDYNNITGILQIGNYKNGKKEGLWITSTFNGGVEKKENYKNGRKEGEALIYSLRLGMLEYRVFYRNDKQLKGGEYGKIQNGKKEGRWITIDDRNRLKEVGNYTGGKKEGKWAIHDDETTIISNHVKGKLEGEALIYFRGFLDHRVFYRNNEQLKGGKFGKFKNGKKEGQWISIGDYENKLEEIGNYSQGKKEGQWGSYNNIEHTSIIGNYRNGQKEGKWVTSSFEGRLIEEGTYDNGKKEGQWIRYHLDGKISIKSDYKNGKKDGKWVRYHPNGQSVLEDGNYSQGKKDGLWVEYQKNGKVFSKINYKNDKEEGLYVAYHSGGELLAKGNYSQGKKEGQWFVYHKNGKIQKKTNYISGKRDGLSILYDSDGKIIEKGLFSNGKLTDTYSWELVNIQAQKEYEKRDYDLSLKLFKKAMILSKKKTGKDYLYDVTSLTYLGNIFKSKGLYVKAENSYKKAIEIQVKRPKTGAFTRVTSTIANSLLNLARFYTAMGEYIKAEPLYLELIEVTLKDYQRNSTLLSENEKKSFFKKKAVYFEYFEDFVVKYVQKAKTDQKLKASNKLVKTFQNLSLSIKAQLLESRKTLLNSIVEKTEIDDVLKKVYEEYKSLKASTSKAINLSETEQEKRGINIKESLVRIKRLERQLYAYIKEQKQNATSVNFSQLQKTLGGGEASIDINRVEKWDDELQKILIHYVIFVVTSKTNDAPLFFILENGDDLESKYSAGYKKSILKKEIDNSSYRQFFAPIGKYLKQNGIEKVYFSPDGVYNSINLNTLKNPETGKYVEEEFDIRVVTTLRDVVLKKNGNSKKRSNSGLAVTMGRPDYTLKLDELAKLEKALRKGKKPVKSLEYVPPTSDKVIAQVKKSTPLKSNWPDLPGTEAEVKAINEVLKKYGGSKGIKTRLELGKKVHELAIKSIRRPKILHIATHGFFVPNEEKKEEEKRNKPTPKIENFSFDNRSGSATFKIISEEPMLRSGIALAGISSYEKAKEKPTDIEDGILTAYEASQMDLRGTELVVLSACETGLGDVQNGEGVYGLQRAFIVAGAENVILSLWKVDDEATKLLMSKFYEEWIGKGKSKRVAFRAAQEYLRGVKKEYEHPYYWGAFQLIGVE